MIYVGSCRKRGAFSLIELAMVIAVSGLMVGFLLQAKQGGSAHQTTECYTSTKLQLSAIRASVEQFARKNDRLPMPAARNVGTENINYGREALAAALDVAGGVTFGALPFQALGLPPTYAGDCWGNKFTYAVTTALTTNASSGGYLDPLVVGNITLKSSTANTVNTNTAYAVISHGEDKLGAVKLNYSGVSKGWCAGATLKEINCLATAAEVADSAFNNGSNAGADYYDDLIIAGGRPQIAGTNLYCWGYNNTGSLGDSTTTDRHYPMPIRAAAQFKSMGAIGSSTGTNMSFCAIATDGTPYCWGFNGYHNVGTSTCVGCAAAPAPTYVSTPQLLPGGFKFRTIDMQTFHGCGIVAAGGLGTAGEVRCWGATSAASSPLLGNSTLGGNYYGVPQVLNGPAAARSFTKLYLQTYNNYAIEADGTTWCWSRNTNGQCGNGAPLVWMTDAGMVAGGTLKFQKLMGNMCGLTTDSKIYCWGPNTNGQLGLGHNGYGSTYGAPPAISITGGGGAGATATARVLNGGIIAVDVVSGGAGYTSPPDVNFAGGHTGAVRSVTSLINSSGAVVGFTVNAMNYQPTEVLGGRKFIDLVSNTTTTCGIEAGTNQLYCWGALSSGLTGSGTTVHTGSGTGYLVAPTVSFAGTTGSGATATATLTGNTVTAITLTASGTGYTTNPTVVFTSADGYGASASATRGGPIASFTVTNAGSGYTPGVHAVNVTATGLTPLGVTAATGCQATVNGTGNVSGIACATYGDGYNTATVSLATVPGGTGAAATVVITQDKVVNLTLNLNNGDVWTPTLVNGGTPQLTALKSLGSAFHGIGTDNRVYSWGSSGGGSYWTGIDGSNYGVPTVLNAYVKNSGCGGPLGGGTNCATGDTTAAGMSIKKFCSAGTCLIDSTDRSYLWRGMMGNAMMQIPAPTVLVRYAIPAATCPTTPVTGIPSCTTLTWNDVWGDRNGSYCAVKEIPLLNCAAQTVNWGSCTANAPAMKNGQELLLTDHTAANTGTATVICNNGVLEQAITGCF